MLADPFQAEAARVALEAAHRHGFALAGGHALIAHGIITRPTEDVDLFTDQSGVVQTAGRLVAAALRQAGFDVDEFAETTELGGMFYGLDSDLVEFEARRDGQAVRLQLVRFDRGHHPVALEIGPVLHLDDVIATKVAALVTRAYPRDFIDVAAALSRYSRLELVELGLQADPALSDEEFAEAMQRLDRLDDTVFMLYQCTPEQIADLRARFADWPR